MPEDLITYCGQTARVCCDGHCQKAWGLNTRPREQLSEDEDDYAFLADDELGLAPDNPGTSEGGQYKPQSPVEFPNKWCVRECERCSMSAPGEWRRRIALKDFSKRVCNIPRTAAEILADDVCPIAVAIYVMASALSVYWCRLFRTA